MSGRPDIKNVPTKARTHAAALRSVSHALRENIELRLEEAESCSDPEERKRKYARCWESCAVTCDDAANYLDEIDRKEQETNHE